MFHFHIWSHQVYFYPYRNAPVIEAIVQKRKCRICSEEQIYMHYDDQESRFGNKHHEEIN